MKYKWKFWLIPLILILFLGFVVKVNILDKRNKAPVYVNVQTVKTITAEKIKNENVLEYTGSIKAFNEALISAKTPGRVSQVLVDNGVMVAAGQPLVLLENQEYNNALAASQAALKKAEANLANVKANYNRIKELYGQGAVSQKDFEDIESGLKIAEADAASAAAGVAGAEESLRNTAISSPISGVTANRNVAVGQYASPGTPLMAVEDISSVYVVINIEQVNLGKIKPGQKATATVDAFADRQFEGEVKIINPAADSSGRVFEVKVRLNNPEHLLKPGMFAKVKIATGGVQEILAVPQNAITSIQGMYFIFIADGEKAKRQQVEIGQVVDQSVEIKAGVNENQKIIVSNTNQLKDGDKIKIAD